MPEDPVDPTPADDDRSNLETVGVTGLPSNVASALAVMIPLLGGVVFLFLERKDRLVRFYSIQSIVLGVLLGAAGLMLGLVELIFRPIPLIGSFVITIASVIYGIYALAWFVLYFVAMAKAFSGRMWAIPYLGPMAKRYVASHIP